MRIFWLAPIEAIWPCLLGPARTTSIGAGPKDTLPNEGHNFPSEQVVRGSV